MNYIKKYISIYLVMLVAIFFGANTDLFAQSGKSFEKFSEKLKPYFNESMIADIKKQLPLGAKYKIWGWDVGDYSGDGYPDCAVSVRLNGDRRKKMTVYLFSDMSGFLNKIGQFSYDFVETPLEIGISIDKNLCAITQKFKKFNWNISSYSYDNGILVFKELYVTKRIGDLTYQKTTNYNTLTNYEKYVITKTGKVLFERKYSNVVSYPRGKKVYKGFEKTNSIEDIDYVYAGAWNWKGNEDLSYKISSSYDDDYIYFTVNVRDDKLVVNSCDTCVFERTDRLTNTCIDCDADQLEIWFDTFVPDSSQDRFVTRTNHTIKFRPKALDGIIKFTVNPGDFYSIPASISISTNELFNSLQKFQTSKLKAVSDLTDDGYVVKFKIPFTLLGFNTNPLKEKEKFEMGVSVCAIDYDNKFRTEDKTELANCPFVPNNPTTYAGLILMPEHKWYGYSMNIYEIEILKELKAFGF
jgi:hypothetical protein